MPDYKAVVTVTGGSTNADITIDGTPVPLGPTAGGGQGGENIVTSAANPIPFVFHAVGPTGYQVTLKVVLSPLPNGTDITFSPPAYTFPNSTILCIANGGIPFKAPATANVQSPAANVAATQGGAGK